MSSYDLYDLACESRQLCRLLFNPPRKECLRWRAGRRFPWAGELLLLLIEICTAQFLWKYSTAPYIGNWAKLYAINNDDNQDEMTFLRSRSYYSRTSRRRPTKMQNAKTEWSLRGGCLWQELNGGWGEVSSEERSRHFYFIACNA